MDNTKVTFSLQCTECGTMFKGQYKFKSPLCRSCFESTKRKPNDQKNNKQAKISHERKCNKYIKKLNEFLYHCKGKGEFTHAITFDDIDRTCRLYKIPTEKKQEFDILCKKVYKYKRYDFNVEEIETKTQEKSQPLVYHNNVDYSKCLLTANDFKVINDSLFEAEKGEIVGNKLKTIMFIQNRMLYIKYGDIYKVQRYTKQDTDLVMATILKVFQLSYKQLGEFEKDYITKNNKLLTSTHIKTYYSSLITTITNTEEIPFDYTPNEIHFKNGYMDMRDGTFKQRTDKHFITSYIDREYKPSPDKKEFILNILKQIYPKEEDLNTIIQILSMCLSWDAPKYQMSLFLLGFGSAGKSTILKILQKAVGPYFHELKSDAFSGSESDTNKVLNSYSSRPNILFSWINEMKDKRINMSLFKSFCDGDISTTKLYQDGGFSFRHNSLVITTMNEMPNFIVDTGSKRRIRGYNHTSKFTENDNEVDEANHVYKANIHLFDNMTHEHYNSFFDILVSACLEWQANNKKINYPKSFTEAMDTIIDSNDHIQDFIDKHLTITQSDKDRIHKTEMLTVYKSMFPEKKLTLSQLMTALKERKIQYNKDLRVNNVRGCYVYVKFKGCMNDDEEEEDDERFLSQVKLYKDLEAKYKELEAKFNQLTEENKALKAPKTTKGVKATTPKKKVEGPIFLDFNI